MLALRLLSEGGGGPDTSLLWLLYIGMALFFMVIIAGWPVGGRNQEQLKVEDDPLKPRKKKVDDLVRIEGIGPKAAKVLRDAGVLTFNDLAQSKVADVQKILKTADLQKLNPEGWIAQAKLAAKGDWDELDDLQVELKGGRKTK